MKIIFLGLITLIVGLNTSLAVGIYQIGKKSYVLVCEDGRETPPHHDPHFLLDIADEFCGEGNWKLINDRFRADPDPGQSEEVERKRGN